MRERGEVSEVLVVLDVPSLCQLSSPGGGIDGGLNFIADSVPFPWSGYPAAVDRVLASWAKQVRFSRFREGSVHLDLFDDFYFARFTMEKGVVPAEMAGARFMQGLSEDGDPLLAVERCRVAPLVESILRAGEQAVSAAARHGWSSAELSDLRESLSALGRRA